MSGRRARRAAAAAALVVGTGLGALAVVVRADAPAWSIPLVAGATLLVGELVSLSLDPASSAMVERRAVNAVLVGRCLTAVLLAITGATVALLAAAVPARNGYAIGLVGTVAAMGLFLLVAALARQDSDARARGRRDGRSHGESTT